MRKKRIEKVMLSVVERLIECLERETADLSGGGMNATRTHIATKSRLLFDLNRAVRETGGDTLTPAVVERLAVLRGALDRNASAIREAGTDAVTPAIAERLAVLRGALDRNASAIRANMAAMRELVGMLHASALRDSTDGTYNRPGNYGQAG